MSQRQPFKGPIFKKRALFVPIGRKRGHKLEEEKIPLTVYKIGEEECPLEVWTKEDMAVWTYLPFLLLRSKGIVIYLSLYWKILWYIIRKFCLCKIYGKQGKIGNSKCERKW